MQSKYNPFLMSTGKDISYQTEYPVAPDTSRQAYLSSIGAKTNFGAGLRALFKGAPGYSEWKQNKMDKYNADLNAYNTWLQSGAGIRASAESGGYNPNFFGDASQVSPLQYQASAPDAHQQGLQNVGSFISEIVGLLGGIESVKGQALKNEAQATTNKYLEDQLIRRNARLGFLADWQEFANSAQAFSMYGGNGSDLYAGGFGTYDISPITTGRGLMYQTALANLDYIRAGKQLRHFQGEVAKFQAQEREFYVTEMQSLERDLLQGNVDWQEYEKQLRQDAQKAGIANQTARTVLEFAKFVASIFGIHIPEISTTENYGAGGEFLGGKTTTTSRGK